MKIKRFFAPDIRKAMKMVKEELGADAVIMSNRSVDGGVEIVAARDFDEQVIHNRLKKQTTESNAGVERKSAGFASFDNSDKPLHVISSSRKKRPDGTIPESPIRRNMDQYLGYAEKMQVASRQQSQKASDQRQVKANKAEISRPDPQPRQASVTAPRPEISVEQIMQEVRGEMRKQISGLTSLIDAKLEALNGPVEQPGQPVRLELLRHLADMGFSRKLSAKIANRLGSHKETGLALEKAQEMLARITPIADDQLLEQGGVAALVGPTGVGKTTTIAKIAAQFILKHGPRQVALITTDNYRIGAHEQLNTYGRILDVPVRVANNAEELRRHIQSFADKRLILIDTAGMSQRDMRLAEQIKTLQYDDMPIKTYLVMSAATQYKALSETIEAFQQYQPQAGILTKLDESVAQGSAISAIIEYQLPLSFLTDGQQVPEDIHIPEAESLIGHCVAGIEQENDYTNELSYDDWGAEGYV
ncbi:flagellar biosynthesis protein FlhF [Methylomarinum sp. Ch1-1]|uniref:Flagellar biosynthesis protein FlhF n=1 Tax=Methylomarinum roseum TaxID=3067653 RepID=A0AAU7NUB4_9GAMM|nr:flagellar biosynthesis protein FlhF [Methylomarinum sp. Ch1-1]MDP4519369.1 flagellar biosynthesis protein FlhF [Methylomarinum sp. Ch1-1]